MATDLTQCTATELLELYRSGAATPVEATQAVLDRIDAVDPTINAFCLVAGEEAMASATASAVRWQRGEPVGPLDGVPVSIKDLILTRGWPTLRGSRTFDPDQPRAITIVLVMTAGMNSAAVAVYASCWPLAML